MAIRATLKSMTARWGPAALDPKESRVALAQVWREEALIRGDLGLLAGSAEPLARADSLLDAAAAVFPSGKYPAQASVVCYEKGRLARMHWQIERAESYRLRALRQFRDAVEIMPEAQNPGLHRRIRGEQVLLGAMGPL